MKNPNAVSARMRPFKNLAAFLILATLTEPAVSALCAEGRTSPPRTFLDASIAGRSLIRQAAERLGGAERLAQIKGLRQTTQGHVSSGLQGYDPVNIDRPDIRRPFRRSWELDFEKKRHRRTSALTFDGATLNFVDVHANGMEWTASPDRDLIWTREGSESGFTDPLVRYAPALVIKRALDNLTAAVWAGEECASGAAVNMVDMSWNDRTRLRLYIEADGRLRRFEATSTDPILGDDIVSYDFEGERVVTGISFPERVVYRRRGAVFSDVKVVDVEINPVFENSAFVAPPGLEEVPGPSAAYPIGNGVYEMVVGDGTDNYVQFFDLGDAVAVFDAPLSVDVSRRIEEQVRKSLGKPIKYVVLSHFHQDHIGGVGYFVKAGATIVASRDNAEVIRHYASSASRLSGAKAAPAQPVNFVFVDAKRLNLRGTQGRSLTIYRLDHLPHVKNMLVAYYAPAAMIANADLHAEFAPFDTNSLLFAQWLMGKDAPQAQWITGGHHRVISKDDFMKLAQSFETLRGNQP